MIAGLPEKDRYSLKEIAKSLDKHISTVLRWALKGVRGRRLPSFLIGGQRYVNREDLERFLHPDAPPSSSPPPGSSSARASQLHAVDAELDAAGL